EGIRDLVLHLLRGAARPVGEDDDLRLGDVRDRVDRIRPHGVKPDGGQKKREAQDQKAVLQREVDEAIDHFGASGFLSGAFTSEAPVHWTEAPVESWACESTRKLPELTTS